MKFTATSGRLARDEIDVPALETSPKIDALTENTDNAGALLNVACQAARRIVDSGEVGDGPYIVKVKGNTAKRELTVTVAAA